MGDLPRIPIEEAIGLAKNYLAGLDLDLNDRALTRVTWAARPKPKAFNWYLYWMTAQELDLPASTRGGGFLEVVVQSDGTVSHTFVR